MPSFWEVEVQDYPDLRDDQVYRLRVTGIRKQRQPPGLRSLSSISMRNRPAGSTKDSAHPHPAGRIGRLVFCACGIEPQVGTTIAPQKTLQAVVGARFGRMSPQDELMIIAFEAVAGRESMSQSPNNMLPYPYPGPQGLPPRRSPQQIAALVGQHVARAAGHAVLGDCGHGGNRVRWRVARWHSVCHADRPCGHRDQVRVRSGSNNNPPSPFPSSRSASCVTGMA